MARDDRLLILLLVLGAVSVITGCIFPEEKVTVDIQGAEQINPNTTRLDGFKIQINNEIQQDLKNMLVVIKVPENIVFKGSVMGKPLNLTVETEAGRGIVWVYRFNTDLEAGRTAVYPFSYTAVVYEQDFKGKNEYSFDIRVYVYDANGNSLGNQTTTWRVTRPI